VTPRTVWLSIGTLPTASLQAPIYASTALGGGNYERPSGEEIHNHLNDFIRHGGKSDSVIDFEKAEPFEVEMLMRSSQRCFHLVICFLVDGKFDCPAAMTVRYRSVKAGRREKLEA
jgi:hypothetical protein